MQASTASLDGLNLGLGPRQTVEALRQLGTVKELTLLRLNRAQRSTRVATDGALSERGTAKWAVLLSLSTVGSERVRKDSRRRRGVSTRSVVDGFYPWQS